MDLGSSPALKRMKGRAPMRTTTARTHCPLPAEDHCKHSRSIHHQPPAPMPSAPDQLHQLHQPPAPMPHLAGTLAAAVTAPTGSLPAVLLPPWSYLAHHMSHGPGRGICPWPASHRHHRHAGILRPNALGPITRRQLPRARPTPLRSRRRACGRRHPATA